MKMLSCKLILQRPKISYVLLSFCKYINIGLLRISLAGLWFPKEFHQGLPNTAKETKK